MSFSKKILFVDDEETILSGFELTLGRSFDVTVSASVTEALDIFKDQGPFAVVVSDFQMPVMTGAEFLQKIREQDKEVVTMLLTGAANLAMVLLFRAVGGMDFRAPRRALGVRARRTMGRRAGAGLVRERGGDVVVSSLDADFGERAAEILERAKRARADAAAIAEETRRVSEEAQEAANAARRAGGGVVEAARRAGGEVVFEKVPATIRLLELFPWLARKMFPLMLAYAAVFFAVPLIRAGYCWWENKNIAARNERRRRKARAALEALASGAAEEKRRAAKGKQALVRVDA